MMRAITPAFLLLLTASVFAPISVAEIASSEPTNFRLGIGMLRYDVHPAPDYMPDGRHTGVTLMAEFPQNNYHGSRFIIYSQDDDDVSFWGYETQLLMGYGLANPGFRIYTGPAWHREVIKVERDGRKNPQIFNGWGWQLGTGWQYRAITIDVAATYRDTRDYRMENRIATGTNTTPAPILGNLLLSYRF
jgi:hypothetical protein